ncbi:MAG: hypothetical protein JWP91_1477 [Fibrobacteres bacterium]|nr:hypothetical protein [Fibrobacterota bacterium]
MKILKNIVLALVVLIAVLALVGLLLPKESKIQRSMVINAPAEVIFDQVNDLKKNEAWSPWKDPTMKLTYGPVTEGKGAVSMWTSKNMGNGSMTIEESVPATSINIGLDFGSMGKSQALWSFQPENGGIKVTEVMASNAGMNPAKRWMSLFSDRMVGPYFERGLASLKQVSESRAAEIKVEQAAAATQQAAVTTQETSEAAVPSVNAAPAVPAAKTK